MFNKEWFIKRSLNSSLKYQENAINKVIKDLDINDKVVLAACPSSGKTVMSIFIIEDYLRKNPFHKVLVLTHGQTILRSQYLNRLHSLNPEFQFNEVYSCESYNENVSVNIALPQSIRSCDLNKIDLLVVDEAHQFYFAKMVQEIIKKTNPSKQLLLTGTPSVFVARKYDIVSVSVSEIFEEQMTSNVYVEIASSNYNFKMQDFMDRELKLNTLFYKNETETTLNTLLTKIIERLKSFEQDKYLGFEPTWNNTLSELKKTMIVCKSQFQAEQVKNFLLKKDISVALSISDNDKDSLEIQRFLNDENCLVLIVVGRGVLGFDFNKLTNVVDMTMSQNVNRIFQLFARVLRKHPENKSKLFFKIAPDNLTDYYKYIMEAVLCLINKEEYENFNGNDFLGLEIPIIEEDVVGVSKSDKKRNPKVKKFTKFSPLSFEGKPILDFFVSVNNTKKSVLNSYAYTTLFKIRNGFLIYEKWTKEDCFKNAKKYSTYKEWSLTEKRAYSKAVKEKWLDEIRKTVFSKEIITEEDIMEEIKGYDTVKEWKKKNSRTWYFAFKNKELWDKTTSYIRKEHNLKYGKQKIRKDKATYTFEQVKEIASKFRNKTEWRYKHRTSFKFAKENNWMKEIISLSF